MITLCACARGKAISSIVIVIVIVNKKNYQISSALLYKVVTSGEKSDRVGFKALDKGHERYKSYFYLATPIDHT